MSVAFIRSNFVRKAACAVCLYTLPLAAQQSTTATAAQPAAVAQTSQSQGAPLPNPFARYIPRDVPAPSFTNAPKLEQLIQNGKIMLSLDDAISIALVDNL